MRKLLIALLACVPLAVLAATQKTVTYDPDKAQPEALTKATTNAGYPSAVQK